MFKFYTKLLLFFCCFISSALLVAQSCTYQLEMFDDFGDGWNDGTLTIALDTVETNYTLTDDQGDGEAFTVTFTVEDGQEMILSYVQGEFPEEVSFNIVDAECNTIYTYGPGSTLQGDSIFIDTLSCPSCVAPNLCSIPTATRLRAVSVDINYSSVGPDTANNAPIYLIEYGLTGFTPGTGTFLTTTDTIFRVQPLMELTTYDIYVSTICYMGQDTSGRVGPLTIMTPLTTDVGVTNITDPVSGCELGAEEVRFSITNFGGEAKSFIPFGLGINGEEVSVPFPNDGLYTGVVGVDSTEFTSFDVTPNFGPPGEYEIQIWTKLDGDQNLFNDTLTSFLYSAPTEGVYPYFINFEDGDGFWMDQERDPTISSWESGTPNAELISEAAGGETAWVSNLTGFTNAGEVSFLYTPCFDLSGDGSEEDPVISFDFINALVGFNTNVILEASIDGGAYTKVGAFDEGINWYNDFFNNWWDQEFGVTPEWRFTAIKTSGLAGASSVRFRFAIDVNDFSTDNEGVGIDNFYLAPQTEVELAALSVTGPEGLACGSPEDFPTITFVNIGSDTAFNVMLNYQVNGGDIVTETFPDTLLSFEQGTYTFTTPYNGAQANQNEIVAWVSIVGDDFEFNDTTSTTVTVRQDIPFYEDFEAGPIAIQDWALGPNIFVANDHNAGSTVLYSNLYQFNQSMTANTPNFGTVAAGDSIAFDYRFVNFEDFGETATDLEDGDSLFVDLIVDCDSIIPSFISITADNHTATTDFTRVAVELPEGIIGTGIQLVFNGVVDPNGTNDLYLDIDNINIKRCAPSLDVMATIFNAQDSMDVGKITLEPTAGIAPYTYEWSNGATTAMIDELIPGNYSVTVTDVQGCSEVYDYTILITSTEEQIETAFADLKVFPNPTNGLLQLQLNVPVNTPLQYVLYNQVGQPVANRQLSPQAQLNESIDLSNQPAGIYFLRITAEGRQRTVRVVKTR